MYTRMRSQSGTVWKSDAAKRRLRSRKSEPGLRSPAVSDISCDQSPVCQRAPIEAGVAFGDEELSLGC